MIKPKSHFLFHENVSLRNFYVMTLNENIIIMTDCFNVRPSVSQRLTLQNDTLYFVLLLAFSFFFLVSSIAWNPILILRLWYPDTFNYSQINFWFNSFKPTHSTLFPFSFFFLVSSIAWNPILILCLCHPDTTTIYHGDQCPQSSSQHTYWIILGSNLFWRSQTSYLSALGFYEILTFTSLKYPAWFFSYRVSHF